MKIAVELPSHLEEALAEEADKLGVPISEYVLRLISSGGLIGVAPKTGADLVKYWEREGLIGSRPEIKDPSKRARALRARSERRRKDK